MDKGNVVSPSILCKKFLSPLETLFELNSERIKNKNIPYPDKRDKCVSDIAFYQKAISNLLNSRRFTATSCGELQLAQEKLMLQNNSHILTEKARGLCEIR